MRGLPFSPKPPEPLMSRDPVIAMANFLTLEHSVPQVLS